ncbi:hypothetical protein Tco_0479093 [Tanacetum coccineum]
MSQRRLLASLQAPILKDKKVVKWINVDQLALNVTPADSAHPFESPPAGTQMSLEVSQAYGQAHAHQVSQTYGPSTCQTEVLFMKPCYHNSSTKTCKTGLDPDRNEIQMVEDTGRTLGIGTFSLP